MYIDKMKWMTNMPSHEAHVLVGYVFSLRGLKATETSGVAAASERVSHRSVGRDKGGDKRGWIAQQFPVLE